MTEDLGMGPAPEGKWDALDPANISPLVVWLGSNENTEVTGRVFLVDGDRVSVAEGWRRGPTARNDQMRWEPSQLTKVIPDLVGAGAAQLDDDVLRSPARSRPNVDAEPEGARQCR